MKRPVRLALAALVALFVGYVGYQVYRAGDGDPTFLPHNTTDIVFEMGKAFAQRGDQHIQTRSWSVDYDRIVANGDQTVLELYGVRNGVVFRNGKPYLRLAAKHATVNTLTHDFFVDGHVHVETIGERPAKSFDTISAQWNDATKTVTMPAKIAIHDGSDPTLWVGSLSYNVKTGDIDITNVAGPARAQ